MGGLAGEGLGAIVVIAVLTGVNLRGLNMGRLVQNTFTTAKVLSLILIIVLGCVIAPNLEALRANFGSLHAFTGNGWSPALIPAFGAAMVGGLFSAAACATVTFTASDVEDPRRDLPRPLALGTSIVT